MGSINLRSQIGLVLVLLLTHGAAPRAAQPTVLVGMMGTDTVAVDRFTRDSTTIEGVVFVRRPQPLTMHYTATISPHGRFSHLEIIWRDPRNIELRSATFSFGTDSIRCELKDGTTRNFGVATALDAIPLPPRPYAAHMYGILEHATLSLLAPNSPRATQVEWISAGATRTEKLRVRRIAGDTVQIDYPAGPVRSYLGTDRRLQWLSIGISPVQTIVTRSEKDLDPAKLAAAFATRDALHDSSSPRKPQRF